MTPLHRWREGPLPAGRAGIAVSACAISLAALSLSGCASFSPDGGISVVGPSGERALPADYVHVHLQLGYVSTVHGAQGDTSRAAHLVVGEHTSAAAGYVAFREMSADYANKLGPQMRTVMNMVRALGG